MNKILVINGSYRTGGITDQMVGVMEDELQSAGADVECISLRDYPIKFCLNCRECTQQPGELPGRCVQHDGMQALIDKIEKADAYIFASPTNFGSVTAIFKRFMERLIVYAYWPWNKNHPKYRKANMQKKKAVLLASCAAPASMGRMLYCTDKQLKTTAKTLGAEVVGMLYTGLIAKEPEQLLSKKSQKKAKRLAARLL